MPRFSFPGLLKSRAVRLLPICVLVCLCAASAGASPLAAATLTVNTLSDSNDGSCTSTTCSLRDAINLANADNDGDTIQFSVSGTITLTSALPAITGIMTIQGPGANVLTISGGHSTAVASVFTVALTNFSSGTFTISGLTISDGVGTSESGTIVTGGTSTVDTFTVGGGIYTGAGIITVSNCIFSGNTATGGGAIFLTANVTEDSGGGGVTETLGVLTIVDSIFYNNSAPEGTPVNPYDFGTGGAVFANGTLTVTGSLFSGNSAVGSGGAIYAGGVTSITNNTFVGNSATGPTETSTGQGGAIDITNQGTVTNNTFVGNTANYLGGAIVFEGLNAPKHLTADNNIYEGNSSGAFYGEAIWIDGGTINIDDSVFYKNYSHGFTDDCDGGNSPSCGPGNNGNIEATSDPLTRPLGSYGGTTETFLPQPGSQAICAGSASLAVDGSNSALTADQRGFPLSSSYCSNGGLDAGSVQSDYLTVNTLNDQLDTTTCTQGAACSLRDAFGILARSGKADIDFSSSLVSVNSPGVITLGSALPAIGGTANLLGPGANKLSVSGGNSSTVGSVFTVNSGATSLMSGLTVTGGNAVSKGGGINNSGTLTLLNSAVSGNASPAVGGGIFNGGTLTMTDSTVSGNSAPHGAGIYDQGSAMAVTESTIFGNGNGSPGFLGGGIYVASGSNSVSLTNATVSANTVQCDTSGGGCIFGDGGGVYIDSGTLTLANSIVAGNSASNGNADISGSYTDKGGNLVNNPTPELSPLEYTGIGATLETAIPLPGSPAICAGTTPNIPSGVTTDERGYPNTNSRYTFGSDPPCVDAGAVQSSYLLFYWAQNPTNTGVNTPITPSPRVTVLEYDPLKSNNPLNPSAESPVAGVPVTLTYSGGAGEIGGSLTATSGSNGATFNGLTPNTQGTGFQFTANSIPVFGSYSIEDGNGGSATFNVTAVSPPSIAASFSPSSIGLSGSTTLTITLSNPNASAQLTGVGFSDTASAGLTIGFNVQNTCGQLVSATSTQIFLGNVTLAAGSSCQVTIPLTPTVYGIFQDTTGVVTSNEAGNGNSASATLTVTGSLPTVTGISPASGTSAGGTSVTITGTSFDANAVQVNFGATAATNVTVVSATEITASSPLGLGTVDVTVTTPSGTSATSPADQFAYVAPNFIVNTTADDSSGTAGNCPAGGSATTCTLRDALAAASAAGLGKITFSPAVFNSPQTIVSSNGTLNIPSITAIKGATSGSGKTLQNLVTISGGSTNNGYSAFSVASGVAGASIANLIITDSGTDYAGGINNAGGLTVQSCTLTGLAGEQAGAIYNNGGTINISDSTISGNTAEYGGALYSASGTVTVTGSTISGNATILGAGGILLTGGAVNVAGSTISGNFAGLYGPGIYNTHGALTVTNSIVSGNQQGTPSSPGNYDDIDDQSGATAFSTGNDGGNVIGYYNANSLSAPTAGAKLASLGNYGGPTQTMVPLPGSAAICAGLAAGISSGVTNDQRGFPNTNTSYPGYSSTPCVDAGAVQTNYALAIAQQPSTSSTTANLVVSTPISPAPAASVTESGNPVSGATVTIADADSALSGTTTQTSAAGTATFSDLSIGSLETNDTLKITLPLNGSLNMQQTSYPFNVSFVLPSLTSPAPGSTLTVSDSTTFTWNPGIGLTSFALRVGTTSPGSSDIYRGGMGTTSTSIPVSGIPTNGVTLYVRLMYKLGDAWKSIDYTYTEAGAPTLPAIATPNPGSTLSGSDVTFNWSPGGGPSAYSLRVGTTSPGSSDIYHGTTTEATSFPVSGVPKNGVTVYVRLMYKLNGTWSWIDYTYTEAGTPVPPVMLTPNPGTTLSDSTVTFTWSAGGGPSAYALRVGTTGVGSSNIYHGNTTPLTSIPVSGIPTNGKPVYVRLMYKVDGVWQAVDFIYTAP